MTARSITLMLLATLTLGSACDSNRATQPAPLVQPLHPAGPDSSVLTALEASPDFVVLYWGTTVELRITAYDQRGRHMTDAGGVTFSSSDSAVARVNSSGLVTGVATGTVEISVTKTVAGVTRSATMTAAVRPASPLADLKLTADLERGWQPSVGHLRAGGTVQWLTVGPRSWSGVEQRVLFLLDKNYEVVDSLDLSTGTATLRLMTAGQYPYCSAGCLTAPDYGIVYVH